MGCAGGREALAPPEDDPVAFVTLDEQWAQVAGLREGIYPNSYYRFLGLRYAEPPVGALRFQRPRHMKLTGEVSARKFGAPCPQPHPDDSKRVTGSEDCLFLNVFTPKVCKSVFVCEGCNGYYLTHSMILNFYIRLICHFVVIRKVAQEAS